MKYSGYNMNIREQSYLEVLLSDLYMSLKVNDIVPFAKADLNASDFASDLGGGKSGGIGHNIYFGEFVITELSTTKPTGYIKGVPFQFVDRYYGIMDNMDTPVGLVSDPRIATQDTGDWPKFTFNGWKISLENQIDLGSGVAVEPSVIPTNTATIRGLFYESDGTKNSSGLEAFGLFWNSLQDDTRIWFSRPGDSSPTMLSTDSPAVGVTAFHKLLSPSFINKKIQLFAGNSTFCGNLIAEVEMGVRLVPMKYASMSALVGNPVSLSFDVINRPYLTTSDYTIEVNASKILISSGVSSSAMGPVFVDVTALPYPSPVINIANFDLYTYSYAMGYLPAVDGILQEWSFTELLTSA